MQRRKQCITGITVLFLFFLFSFVLRAQQAVEALDHLIPPSPGAAALTKTAGADVSLYTGTPSVTIPIWTLQGEMVSVPVSLSYHSNGMKVGEIPGWTGLGWTLHAGGAITRVVRGTADDLPKGYLSTGKAYLDGIPSVTSPYYHWSPPGGTRDERYAFLREAAMGRVDLEPDLFSYSFNGHSGRFLLDARGVPLLLSPGHLKITYERDYSGNITRWEITDDQGVRYLFGGYGAVEKTYHYTANGSPSQEFNSSWQLEEIISPNGEDHFFFRYGESMEERRYPVSLQRQGDRYPSWDDVYKYTSSTIAEKHLQEIIQTFNGHSLTITFVPEVLEQFPGGTITALREIIVNHPAGDALDRHFLFDYSFFPSTGCGTVQDYLRPCKRLRLDKITEMTGTLSKPPYLFFYDEQPLPPRGSFSKDLWGFYNGKKNETPVPAVTVINDHDTASLSLHLRMGKRVNFRWFQRAHISVSYVQEGSWKIAGADRSPDTVAVQAGLLKRIVYPTGGTTLLQYEANKVGYVMAPDRGRETTVVARDSALAGELFYLPFPQEIRFEPLFYRENEKGHISEYDSVNIFRVKEQGDRRIFSVSYKKVQEEAAGDEAEYRLWLEKGYYKIVAKPFSGSSVIVVNLYYHANPADRVYPVYSNEYEQAVVRAGQKRFPDDSSYTMIQDFEVGYEDDHIVHFSWFFRSDQAPNIVSTATLEHPFTVVQLLRLSDGRKIFEHFFPVHDSVPYNPVEGYHWSGEKLLELSTGRYRLIFRPRVPSEAGYLRAEYEKRISTHPWAVVGGVRLSRKIDLDRYNDTVLVKEYLYNTDYGKGDASSGVLMHYPLYYEQPEDLYFLGTTVSYSTFPMKVYSLARVEDPVTQGNHIGYSMVTEKIPGSGRTVSCFVSPLDHADVSQPVFPFAPATSLDWKRGMLKEKFVFGENDRIREHVVTRFNALDDSVYNMGIPAVKVVQQDPDNLYSCRYTVSLIRTGWNHPLQQEHWVYDTTGRHAFHTLEIYGYNNRHYRLQRRTTFTSDSAKKEKVITCAEDADTTLPGIQALLAKHMTGVIVQEETLIDTTVVEGYRICYGKHGSLVVPDSVMVLEGGTYHTRTFFDRYDIQGRLVQYHHRGDVFHAVNRDRWGHPVVKADNAVWEASGSYPATAMVTRYSYDPLFGMTSVEDPNGNVTSYGYDPLGRLTVVRDPGGRIVKTIAYHYRTYQGDTSRPVYRENNDRPSLPADTIIVSTEQPVRNCPVTLTVRGGALGTGAQWHWYRDGCAVVPAGTGSALTVSPAGRERYFVRAEGTVNNTACRGIIIDPVMPAFLPDRDTLFVALAGTTKPKIIFPGYTGCEPWQVKARNDWLTITEKNEDSFMVTVTASDTARMTLLTLVAGSLRHQIPVVQGDVGDVLTLTLTASPSFVNPGMEVTVTATVDNCADPSFSWVKRTNAGETTLTADEDHPWQVTVTAGSEPFFVECTVTCGNGQMKTASVRIMVYD